MTASVKQLLEAAHAVVPRISAEQAEDMVKQGAVVIDVRDAPEVETTGKIDGALHISRGMLEFRADPESPFHDNRLSKDKPIIVYCASGGRAALAAKVLKDFGYTAYNLGGFKEWADNGGAVDKPIDRGM
ncbi:rhodanese-like domain-containing protein [Rhodopseudomonas palustris]|uniref:rhodanese-like domain-containing protein n=1 Tax=Rhodopseudomonas palustris TaxID=1076 RepID=UPI0020CC07E4|nr:rhodanese-like domain-containing protein [Rhodopseudomonas palustris]MCP9629356.1 rhodanese-like domain-containing protein [Rhodopseudomonas palustris]